MPKPIVHKLLVTSILIKYLEERQDESGNTVFPAEFFNKFANGAKTFVDVFKKKGACLALFDELSRHFNGEIFNWASNAEREFLLNVDLTPFVSFLEGNLEGQQFLLWRLYSFNDLPIELISNIYEEFLDSKTNKGAIYTPPYLVDFLIDECMPLTTPKENFKVIDPACGSGVFLVAAYRRIIYWWRIKNEWEKPNLATLKKLLKENIYGVDMDEEAVRLAAFSLSLALCDELNPKIIWEELKFDTLIENNLFAKDFFQLIDENHFTPNFDLVIGNPPFLEALKTTAAKKIEKQRLKERCSLPNKQIALLFLDQAITLCKDNALLCLILPSGPLLYNNDSFKFRKHILETYDIPQIIDFTHICRILFNNSDVATLALFVKNELPSEKDILHVTIRRTKPVKEKLYFELDKYDFFNIPKLIATSDRLIWKSNFLGGGRIYHLVSRLAPLRKLKEFIKEEGFIDGEGFILGSKTHKTAPHLTGKNTLPTQAFTESGIANSEIYTLMEKFFQNPRREEIYNGPHLLIKETIGENSIPVEFREDDLSFKNSIIGIHSHQNDVSKLKEIERRIKNNRTYLFYVAATSGRFMINKSSSILKDDIDNLPYPKNEKELDLSYIEKILVDDFLDYLLEFRRKGENSKIVENANSYQLNQFGEVFCLILNSVYKKFEYCDPITTNSFICYPFYYGNKPDIVKPGNEDDIDVYLDKLVKQNIGTSLRINKILRIYDNNIIYLIKPKQLRYWLRSIAIRDADETFSDLVEQGY